MRTNPQVMFSAIAIPAKHLQRWVVWKSVCSKRLVQACTRVLKCLSMGGPVFINMIDRQKGDMVFAAAITPATVGFDNFFSKAGAAFSINSGHFVSARLAARSFVVLIERCLAIIAFVIGAAFCIQFSQTLAHVHEAIRTAGRSISLWQGIHAPTALSVLAEFMRPRALILFGCHDGIVSY